MAYKRLTQEEVIRRFREVHGSRYDYSSVEYKGYDNKVTIICRQHGAFEQEVGVHLKGWGCPICGDITRARKKKKSTKQFIDEARKVHGDRYDYSKTIYKGTHNKVTITCREHGDFEQLASNHLKGNGCPLCAGKNAVTMKNFVELARAIHGDKYGYDRVLFTKVSDKVWIYCPVHGWYQQSVSCHIIKKHGCRLCAAKELGESRIKSKVEFVRQARLIHGDKYDYSKAEYVNTRTKILIICNECGREFWQTPQNHISKRASGCPCRKEPKGEERIRKWLIDNDIKFIAQYKLPNEDLFCSNKNLFVDFFLPKHDIAIEFNGEQHYKPIDIFGGKERYVQQVERDNSLRQYCKEHKIRLIEIPYKDIDNIEDILTKELKIHKNKT